MGADIHAIVMVKQNRYKHDGNSVVVDGADWKMVNLWQKTYSFSATGGKSPEFLPAECFYNRDYQLFGVLAGVRSNEYPMLDDNLRGLPGGCPREIVDYVEKSWKDCAHSITWYSLGELNKAVKDKKKYPKHSYWYDDCGRKHVDKAAYGPHYGLKSFRDSVEAFAASSYFWNDDEDVRVVIFFDS